MEMTKQTKSSTPGVSGASLARLFKLDERTVRKLAEDGILVRLERGQYDKDASITNYVVHLRDIAGRRANSSQAAQEHARYKRAMADKVEIELAEKAGKHLRPRRGARHVERHDAPGPVVGHVTTRTDHVHVSGAEPCRSRGDRQYDPRRTDGLGAWAGAASC
jgi:hypothetical protein